MWVQQDRAMVSLTGAPDPVDNSNSGWAEFQVSVQANRIYETYNFNEPECKKAMSTSATIATCNDGWVRSPVNDGPVCSSVRGTYADAISRVALTGSFSTLQSAVRFSSRGRTRSLSQK